MSKFLGTDGDSRPGPADRGIACSLSAGLVLDEMGKFHHESALKTKRREQMVILELVKG